MEDGGRSERSQGCDIRARKEHNDCDGPDNKECSSHVVRCVLEEPSQWNQVKADNNGDRRNDVLGPVKDIEQNQTEYDCQPLNDIDNVEDSANVPAMFSYRLLCLRPNQQQYRRYG